MNKVMLVGYIGKREIDLKFLPGTDKAVCSYTISVPRPYKDKEYDYINCVTFGKQAEFLANNQDKIKKLEIEGRLQVRNYDKDGQKRYATEVITDNVGVAEWGEKQQHQNTEGMQEVTDGDIPF